VTRFLDLGHIDTPLLVFGGPYSNLRATTAIKAEAEARGIPPERVICTGDVVAYAAEPAETTALMMDWGCVTVMGNCEQSFGAGADDCGCGFDEGTACDVLSRQWYAYADAALTPEMRAWMRATSRRVDFQMGGRRFAVVHGSAETINEFVIERGDDSPKRTSLETLGVDAVIGGHSGVPYAQTIGERLWLNAGVVGMPANDGTPRVWFAVLTPETDAIGIEILPRSYDHAAAAQAMRDRGLPEGYARCLETGLWPNMDVMPEAEKNKVGQTIAPICMVWPASRATAAE